MGTANDILCNSSTGKNLKLLSPQYRNFFEQSQWKTSFDYIHSFFLSSSFSGFRFLERQFSAISVTRTPQKQMRQKPTEPTSPSRLPALLSSALPDSPLEKVASPPPHQPQCCDMPVFMHIKRSSTPLCAAESEMSCMQNMTTLSEELVSLYRRSLKILFNLVPDSAVVSSLY